MFLKGLQVYPKDYVSERNISVLFPVDFVGKKATLKITGRSEFQVFLNGNLLAYGPARSAHGYHRVDEYNIKSSSSKNRLLIIVCGYNINTFDAINEKPFLSYELSINNEIVSFSNVDSECYLNETKYQKVTRFSYQRGFSESYKSGLSDEIYLYGNKIQFKKLELISFVSGEYLPRNVHYPILQKLPYTILQKESFVLDESIKPYEDRYMYNEAIGVFPKAEWEIDANKIVSQISITKENRKGNSLKAYQSITYGNEASQSGFIYSDILVKEDSEIYIYFEELNTSNIENTIDFKFYRNTTHNCITYKLSKGNYHLVTAIPYTAKYIRVCCLSGLVDIKEEGIILLENPDSYNFKYKFEDKRIQNVIDAARRTFAANAVDILTDCPSRERAGWLCDSFFSSRAETMFTGFNLVETNFLENYSMYRPIPGVPEKMIPMCYPADFGDPCYIPNWAMYYVLEIYNCYKRTDDITVVNKAKKTILDLVDFFKQEENSDGLLEDLKGWVFVEWSHENDADHICGVNIPTNILYSKMLHVVDELYDMPKLGDHCKAIQDWILKNAFNGTYFVDNLIRNEKGELVQTKNIGETTQYYAFYFDLVSKQDMPELFDLMIKDFGLGRDDTKVHPDVYKSNVIVGVYQRLELLNRYGLYENTLNECVDYFNKMAKTSGTLWEHDSISASLNHGFASFVANMIVKASTGYAKTDYIHKVVYIGDVSYDKDYVLDIPTGNKYIHIEQINKKKKVIIPEGYTLEKYEN